MIYEVMVHRTVYRKAIILMRGKVRVIAPSRREAEGMVLEMVADGSIDDGTAEVVKWPEWEDELISVEEEDDRAVEVVQVSKIA